MAHHPTSSPHPSSNHTFCIAQTSINSRHTLYASAPAASASSPCTFWSVPGKSSTSCALKPHTGSQPSSVCRQCAACSAWPRPCPTVCPAPPSIAWDCDCTKASCSTLLTSTANDAWSTCLGVRGPRTATSPSRQTPSSSHDTPGQRTDILPGSFPPPAAIQNPWHPPPSPCIAAASQGPSAQLNHALASCTARSACIPSVTYGWPRPSW